MRRDAWTAARALALATIALLFVAAFLPGRLDPAVRLYALLASGVAILLALSALRRALPPARGFASTRGWPAPRPVARLARLERETALGMAGSFDFHYRFRPRLRALAAGLLDSRRGISLDDDPEAAAAALGRETWDLVRGDRPSPDDRLARGLTHSELSALVESLERV